MKNLTFKHEFIHAFHYKFGYFNTKSGVTFFSERSCYSYEIAYTKAYGLTNRLSNARVYLKEYGGMRYHFLYSWRRVKEFGIKMWIY